MNAAQEADFAAADSEYKHFPDRHFPDRAWKAFSGQSWQRSAVILVLVTCNYTKQTQRTVHSLQWGCRMLAKAAPSTFMIVTMMEETHCQTYSIHSS
jgi:hypothetical protein